jgi:hypothetical protein
MGPTLIQFVEIAGAFGFGAIVGWYVYYVNRYRRSEVQIGDVTTLIGVLGGAAVLTLYKPNTVLFGAYGVGLFVGFFGYFATLCFLVKRSANFTSDWFLDGRRKNPAADEGFGAAVGSPGSSGVAMSVRESTPSARTEVHFHGLDPRPGGDGFARAATAMGAETAQTDSERIVAACKQAWSDPTSRSACNFFVTDVAKRFGVTISGTADQIVDALRADAAWTVLADGVAARAAAGNGMLVVAGIRSTDYTPARQHGHLAIVTIGQMNPSGWAPAGYWGSLDADIAELGGAGSPISTCFSSAIKDKIVYRGRKI